MTPPSSLTRSSMPRRPRPSRRLAAIESDPIVADRDVQRVVVALSHRREWSAHWRAGRSWSAPPESLDRRMSDTGPAGCRHSPSIFSWRSTPNRRVTSRTCHSSAARRPKSSSMLGRRPSARSRTVRNILSTSCLDSAIAAPSRLSAGARPAFDPAQLHAQGGEHLPHVIVQLTGEIPALFFLRRDQPL